MKLLLTIVCLIAATGSCFAQSSLVLYDGDENPVGTVITVEHEKNWVSVFTPDGLVIEIVLTSGWVVSSHRIVYADAVCAGPTYIGYNADWVYRGGVIFQDQAPNGNFYQLEWTPTKLPAAEVFTDYECWTPDAQGCTAYTCNLIEDYTQATLIDNAKYGISETSEGVYGFKIPLTPRVQRSDSLFCNGFENCPTE